jgi:hypothetical protein
MPMAAAPSRTGPTLVPISIQSVRESPTTKPRERPPVTTKLALCNQPPRPSDKELTGWRIGE